MFAAFSTVRYISRMDTSALDSLPAPVRIYLKKLEKRVARLEKAVADMKRLGLVAPVQNARAHSVPSAWLAKAAPAAEQAISAKTGLEGAVAQGEAAKVAWVASGEVIPARSLADAWGLTPQALGPAADRNELFPIVVKSRRYYPREFLQLNRDDVSAVSKALGNLSPTEKLVFWKRSHGALNGKTVLQVLQGERDNRQLDRVTRLAQAFASEANPGPGSGGGSRLPSK